MDMLSSFTATSIATSNATHHLQEWSKANTNYENVHENNTINFFSKRHRRNQRKKIGQIKINTKTLSTMSKR